MSLSSFDDNSCNSVVFYIQAPDFNQSQPWAVQLHGLCHLLNRLGHEAYVTGCTTTSGHLWTPRLSPATQAAHYRVGRLPVTVRMYAASAANKGPHAGLLVQYLPEGLFLNGVEQTEGQVLLQAPLFNTETPAPLSLRLPWADTAVFHPDASVERDDAPLVYAEVVHAHDGQIRPEHAELYDISPSVAGTLSATERAQLLRQAPCLYVYEVSSIVTEARLCGCPVVYVSNDTSLPTPPNGYWNAHGTVWNQHELSAEQQQALATDLQDFLQRYQALVAHSPQDVAQFAQAAQVLVSQLTPQQAWPGAVLEPLTEWAIDKKALPAWADECKYRHLQEQYQIWRQRSSLREIDADIYAEYVASGTLEPLAVVVYAQPTASMEHIAQTLDSLGQNFWQPASLTVVAPFACPVPPTELGDNFHWVLAPSAEAAPATALHHLQHTPWLLLLDAGTVLEPHALAEFSLATRHPGAQLVYCDDDSPGAGGGAIPHFKPGLNIEWLRSFNYLGSTLAVCGPLWLAQPNPMHLGAAYGVALRLSAEHSKTAIQHIDTVLAHCNGPASMQAAETEELAQLQAVLTEQQLKAYVQPGATWGSRLIEYRPQTQRTVSVVVPTGHQLGYMQCLLRSLVAYQGPELAEVVLVTQTAQHDTVRRAVAELELALPVQIVTTPDGPYNHGAALNAGAQAAQSELLLFADDDTECLHEHWLRSLCGYMDQADIACVAPRLTLQIGKEAKLVGGPMIAGVANSAAPYLGERQLLEEQGCYSRLQTAQDVPAVAGHCFLTRRSVWQTLGGFDATTFSLTRTVLDYCLRASQQHYRHVWTPVSNVLHQGGKTLALVSREPTTALQFQATVIAEQQQFLARWGQTLAKDGLYNRHLSLLRPYDIETDIVIDWPRDRKDRPTVLALPLPSGSGQYRVVEPLNALQDASLAKTCVVYPGEDRGMRTPSPVELARAAPDRLIVQHSIGDGHLKLLRAYKQVCPNLFIIQMVDDLLRDLAKDHPHHQIHQREGNVRMREALELSDRLIVSTQPLAEAYQEYCPDVHVVPNCLDEQTWGHFYQGPPPERQRLRVGWAGAGQHLGDLKMMVDVVSALSDEVDWIFMGMCPNELRPYIKEFHPFVSYAKYPKELSALDLNIAIAPLEDNAFNTCKSNLRLLEYGAMGWPVVCSDVYPFRTEDPPVFRCSNQADDWLQQIKELIGNRALRQQQGQALNQWVQDNFYLSKNAQAWKHAIFQEPASPPEVDPEKSTVDLSTRQDNGPHIHLYQIAYSPESLAQIQPGYLVLDNMENERPDWFEYWPIRKFLLSTELNENDFYGFFSPKFAGKTGLGYQEVKNFVLQDSEKYDVFLFSPRPEISTFFLNIFEGGNILNPEKIEVFQDFLSEIGCSNIDLKSIVMSSEKTVFSNYFVARPSFWRRWLKINEILFSICESTSHPLQKKLTAPTNYPNAQRKVFMMESMASLILSLESHWKSKAWNSFKSLYSSPKFNDFKNEIIIMDALKLAYRHQGFPEYIELFFKTRFETEKKLNNKK